LPPGAGVGGAPGGRVAQPAPGPPARPRLVAEPDRNLLLGGAAQGADPQRLPRPRRGPAAAARLPAPLPADGRAVRLALYPRRPRSAPSQAGRAPPARHRSMITTHELPYVSTKFRRAANGKLGRAR